MSFFHLGLVLQLPAPLIQQSWKEMLITCEFHRRKLRLREVYPGPSHTTGLGLPSTIDWAQSQAQWIPLKWTIHWRCKQSSRASRPTTIASGNKPLLGARHHTTQSPNLVIWSPGKTSSGECHQLLPADVVRGVDSEKRSVFPREDQQGCGWVHFINLGLPDLHLSSMV